MPKPKVIRKLRHWKQRFDKNAAFIWRRRMLYRGTLTIPGTPIPELLANNRTKLRRFWESKVIELAEFDAPNVATGVVDEKPIYQVGDIISFEGLANDVVIEKGKGSWFVITRGTDVFKVNGQANLDEAVEELREDAKLAAKSGHNGSDGGDADA